ncbi:MAG: hypothetical protein KGM17_11225 [Sphingomonadales bacterium]|nr:hypothetical protein [Sphingomonadales bacterium]
MRIAFLLPAALPITLLAAPAHAEALAGPWRVTGAILGHAFALDCRFSGSGGTCTETGTAEGKAGKVHALTSASQSGNRVTWSYPASAFLMKFDMTFTGTLAGDAITGTATAAGRKGTFTARRN